MNSRKEKREKELYTKRTKFYLFTLFAMFTAIIISSYIILSSPREKFEERGGINVRWSEDELQEDEYTLNKFGDSKVYKRTSIVPYGLSDNTILAIGCNNAFIYVYIEDNLIYSFSHDDLEYGDSPGHMWNTVNIDSEYSGKEISIISEEAYEKQGNNIESICFMQKDQFIYEIFQNNTCKLLLCTFIFMIGIVGLFANLVFFDRISRNPSYNFMCLASAMLSLWSMTHTSLFQYYGLNMYVIQCIEYVCLPIAGAFFVQYMSKQGAFKNNMLGEILSVLFFCIAPLNVVLDYTGVSHFTNTLRVSQLIFLFIFTINIKYSITYVFKKGEDPSKRVYLLVGNSVVCILMLIDWVNGYLVGGMDLSYLSRIGLALFILCTSLDHMIKLTSYVQVIKETNTIKRYVYIDALTELHNRKAFNEKMEELEEDNINDVGFIQCDINDLKYVNDQYGHDAGDKYIVDAADVIKEISANIGTGYRVGGDEFVIIIEDNVLGKCDEGIQKLRNILENHNVNAPEDRRLMIAAGVAIYNEETDKDKAATLARADKEMYKNKKELKASRMILSRRDI